MTDKSVWFVTGAGRGMGVDIVKAALAAGHAVVATGRNTDAVAKALGDADRLLVVKLDVTRPEDAKAAVAAAVERFGRIDVLVNNAGNFYAGFFEELSPEDFRAQVETNLFGPVNVTRAVLPVMRAPAPRARRDDLLDRRHYRAGVRLGLRGGEVRRRGVDRVADPRGRAVRHPHHARGARLLPHRVAHRRVDEVARALDRRLRREDPRQTVAAWKKMSGLQGGDPAKLAKALVQLASQAEPPLRWPAGADAVETFEKKARELLAQANAHRELSSSLAHDAGK